MTKIVKKMTKNAGEDVGERYLRITSVLLEKLQVGAFTPVISVTNSQKTNVHLPLNPAI